MQTRRLTLVALAVSLLMTVSGVGLGATAGPSHERRITDFKGWVRIGLVVSNRDVVPVGHAYVRAISFVLHGKRNGYITADVVYKAKYHGAHGTWVDAALGGVLIGFRGGRGYPADCGDDPAAQGFCLDFDAYMTGSVGSTSECELYDDDYFAAWKSPHCLISETWRDDEVNVGLKLSSYALFYARVVKHHPYRRLTK